MNFEPTTKSAEPKQTLLRATAKRMAWGYAADVTDGEGNFLGQLKGNLFGWRQGEVLFDGHEYQLRDGGLHDGDDEIASFIVQERFMALTRVTLIDCFSRRQFTLRQKRIWSGQLVLLEDNDLVAELSTDTFHTYYQSESRGKPPQTVLLLSLWLAMIGMVFNA